MPEAFPAVTTPLFRNTGLSAANFSDVVSGRICSSLVISSIFPVLGLEIGTGTTSSRKTPSSQAALDSCCDLSANSSTQPRSSLYLSARFSAVSAIPSPTYESVRPSQSTSSITGALPKGVPHLSPRVTCGACDIDSAPPTRQACASPRIISCAPLTTAWKPEPQRLLSVSAEV